jgi:hypothetical protein
MTARPLELLLLGATALFCILLMVEAWQIRPPARVFPVAVLGTTLALTLLALVRALFRAGGSRLFIPGHGRIVLAAAAGLVVYVLAMSVHYLAATFVFLLAAYIFLLEERGRREVITAVLVAAFATGFTWLTFSVWLGVNLPR